MPSGCTTCAAPPAGDARAKFGSPELQAAVASAVAGGRFRRPPVLIGDALSLADARWGAAIEAAMGPQLDSWIVDSHADAAVLKVHFCLGTGGTVSGAGV